MAKHEAAYYNPRSTGSLGGVSRLHSAVGGNRRDAQKFLRGEKTYQLHKPRRVKFRRRRYQVSGIDDLWQADLADMQNVKRQNGGYSFLLVVIDVFSKMLWVRPIKNKTAMITLDAIDDIIMSSQRRPRNFMTDKGTEFVNVDARKYFKSLNINFYTANNPETKAAVAERVIRTLKSRIYRYFTKHNTKRYIDALQDIVDSYNNSVHRSIKMKPVDVTPRTEDKARKNLYPLSIVSNEPEFKFNLYDDVRVAITPSKFTKGYLPKWTEEVFIITKRFDTIPPTYRLQDENGEIVTGSFYEPELQLIERPASPEL